MPLHTKGSHPNQSKRKARLSFDNSPVNYFHTYASGNKIRCGKRRQQKGVHERQSSGSVSFGFARCTPRWLAFTFTTFPFVFSVALSWWGCSNAGFHRSHRFWSRHTRCLNRTNNFVAIILEQERSYSTKAQVAKALYSSSAWHS